jgi:hypothetical protein
MSRRILFFAAALALYGGLAHANDVNPAYASWAKCKAGTNVKSVTETDAAGQKSRIETCFLSWSRQWGSPPPSAVPESFRLMI